MINIILKAYWDTFGRSRAQYWAIVATRVNNICNSNNTGQQCRRKFSSLVANYNVSIMYSVQCFQNVLKYFTNHYFRIWSYMVLMIEGEPEARRGAYFLMNSVQGFGRSQVSIGILYY